MATEEEQLRYLEDALKEVKKQAFLMKRAMDGDSLKQALDHATEMLRELRTGLLTPKNYYELFTKVVDEMRELEEYLLALSRNGRSVVDVYETVQSCANIVPRLYLLCCVGGVYISAKEAPAKDVLKDLIEMIKGVQHPMRGLFLRYYLTFVTKNRLPDANSVYQGIGGGVQDACSFLLQNFIESNRLWVRLQSQGGGAKEKKKREKERLDLRVLVGANLVRLSQLEGLDVTEYKTQLLPKILEEIISCKDIIAQSYLMDCVIQVFPDDFHLATLEPLLGCCGQLKERVNVRAIFEGLMDRLANHAATTGSALPAEVNAFKLFNDVIATLIEERSGMSLVETLRLQTALTQFALKCFPTRVDFVAHCLGNCGALLAKSGDQRSDEATAQIEALLSAPLASLGLRVLDIPAYGKLMAHLPWSNWKEVALGLLRAVAANNSPLSEVAQAEALFRAIAPLLRDREDSAAADDERDAAVTPQFREEQSLVARVPHIIQNEDTDVLLTIFQLTRAQFTAGGARRMAFTFPALVFAALALARRVCAREAAVAAGASDVSAPQFSTRKVFHFVIDCVSALATSAPETALKLFLNAAQAADDCRFPAIAYEFVKEALLLYESDVTDSRAQVAALTAFIGTMLQLRHLPGEDYEALATKVAQYSNKLLKKSDQCRLVSQCALLFWPPRPPPGAAADAPPRYSDADRVLECMQRALKIASTSNPNLFVEILDRYLYFYENDNPAIQVRYISGLIALINENFAADPSAIPPATEAHYRNTLAYIKSRQESADTLDKFAQIQL